MTKELLQQCLDALIESRDDVDLCYAGVKAARLSFRQERQLGFYEEQLVKHDAAIEGLKQALAQQEQPASVDAYVGAREDAAIWKKRALEAEGLNRKFIAEVNGPTYLGEPVKQEQPAAWTRKGSEAASESFCTVTYFDTSPPYATYPAQEQPAQKPDLWKTQFLTDVMTSAGLLMYGRTDKKLAQRIADGSARWRTELYTHPAPTQPAPINVDVTFSRGDVEKLPEDQCPDWCATSGDRDAKVHVHLGDAQPELSDDEILNCFYASKSEGMVAYMLAVGRAIEAHCRGGADK